MVEVVQLFAKTLLKVNSDLNNYLSKLKKNETGATAVEYALIVGLIAVVIIAAVTLLGTQVRDIFTSITNAL
ncbi:MAG: Flp family type IVb pilin [Candidatus Nanopelagicaceae bacterium]